MQPDNATVQHITQTAHYVQSLLDQSEVYTYGNEPEMQVDFHIPCDEEHAYIAEALAAIIPAFSRLHSASAFRAGEYVQLSLHKEPSAELAESFLVDALSRVQSEPALANKVIKQIEKNQKAEALRVQARIERLQALKAKKAPIVLQ